MAEDVSAEVAGLISSSKVFGSSDNIRHGKYKMLITRIHAQLVETDKGKQKMAFCEMTPLESHVNPQIEGDHVDYPNTMGPLKDDGNKPNLVGSRVALKVNFDGAGGRSAGANIKKFILGLFGKRDGEIPDAEVNNTWVDLARVKDLKKGDAVGIDPQTNQPIFSQVDKPANMGCGMIIWCETLAKKKKTPNQHGAFITNFIWDCKGSPPGAGDNAFELVTKRRAEIEAARVDDEFDEPTPAAAPSPYGVAPSAPAPAAPMAAPVAAAPAFAPPPPAAPPTPTADFVPPAPWIKHPSQSFGATPETRWYWDQGSQVKNEAQLRSSN